MGFVWSVWMMLLFNVGFGFGSGMSDRVVSSCSLSLPHSLLIPDDFFYSLLPCDDTMKVIKKGEERCCWVREWVLGFLCLVLHDTLGTEKYYL